MSSKISDLTALTGANLATDDLVDVVDTSATANKKMTIAQFILGFIALGPAVIRDIVDNSLLSVDGAVAKQYRTLRSGYISSAGDTQVLESCYTKQTTTATPAEALINGSSHALANNIANTFRLSVTARKSDGSAVGSWKFEGVIKRGANAAATAFVGDILKTIITAPSGWDCDVTADTTGGGLKLTVTGATSTTINWFGHLALAQVQ